MRHRLAADDVAFEEVGDGVWTLASGPLVLGRFDERTPRVPAANG